MVFKGDAKPLLVLVGSVGDAGVSAQLLRRGSALALPGLLKNPIYTVIPVTPPVGGTCCLPLASCWHQLPSTQPIRANGNPTPPAPQA
jgi:hypothetical protein